MRFHVISLPHTQTTSGFECCAYTQKVINFCKMMKMLDHTVYLYSGAENTAECDEHIPCIDKVWQEAAAGENYVAASFDGNEKHWTLFNAKVIERLNEQLEPTDFICVISGFNAKPIADAFPFHLTVEFGVGYGGTFAPYKVYESYAWMHTCYGAASGGNPHNIDGNWYDTVIPGYLDMEDFTEQKGDNFKRDYDYLLYVGRLIDRKGVNIAVDIAKRTHKRLVMAGPGTPPDGVEYLGVLNKKERCRWMTGAKALLVPTIYIEPFGNVAIEAMACGTPVISTDWGAFTETIIDGKTGFRCRTMSEFCEAVELTGYCIGAEIREHVNDNYSLPVVANMYEVYFNRLFNLFGEGWYS